METINILFVVFVVTVPFAENAPQNAVTGSMATESPSRLVFIDEDANYAVKSNSKIPTDAISQTPVYKMQESSTRARSTQNFPSSEVKAVESSSLSAMDDDRRIWGIVDDSEVLIEDESYYNRPISLPKIITKIPKETKPRIVSKVVAVTGAQKPSACDISILQCCETASALTECFKSQGCNDVTPDMLSNMCSSESINGVIKGLVKYYKGNQTK